MCRSLDGAPAANVSVALATLRTTTDASGRFVFALRARGSFALRVDTRAMATASRRCITHREPVMVEHDGSAATRLIRARDRSDAPLAPTGCSQM
jgi:hypothetical protein